MTDKTDHIIWFLQQQKQRNPLTPRGVMPRGERGNENVTVSVSTVCTFVTLSNVEGSHSVTVKKMGFFDFAQNDNPRMAKKRRRKKTKRKANVATPAPP